MVNSAEEGLRTFKQREKELQTCIASKGPNLPEHMNQLLVTVRSTSQDLILHHFELARRRSVENRLWDLHGKVNSHYRKQLRQFRDASGQRKVVEQRAFERHFLGFVKSSQRFYRGLIQSLGAHFGGVKELEAVANRLTLSTSSAGGSAPTTGNLQRLLLLTCHQVLIHLGDLSRWRETELETKDRNWGPAIGYYDLAGRIYPASGTSHNQLAVIALQDSDHLGAMYHLYLALAVEEPHPNAKDNLEIEFKKIEDLWSNRALSGKVATESRGMVNDITALFPRLHAYLYRGQTSSEQEELECQALNQLAVDLKGRSIDVTLRMVVLVSIAAEFVAGQRLRSKPEIPTHVLLWKMYVLKQSKEDPMSVESLQSFTSLQRLNVGLFSTLLQVLQTELEQKVGEEAIGNGSHEVEQPECGPAKLSALSRQILPGLRQYSSWLLINAPVLMANSRDDALNVQLQELWRAYATILTLLVSIFPREELYEAGLDYMLDDDETTLGFLPFKDDCVQRRYFKDDGTSQKPRYHDSESSVQRHHPYKEMLGRVRDLLTDGMIIQKRTDISIMWENSSGRFIIYAGNKYSESDGQAHLPSTAIQIEESIDLQDTFCTQSASAVASSIKAMEDDSKRTVDGLADPGIEGERNAADCVIERVTQSPGLRIEDTSYGLIGSATVLEHFGEPDEAQVLASSRRPRYQQTPDHSRPGSQNIPILEQPSKYFGLPSSNSSMPTPTFQNTNPERLSADAGHQHSKVHKRNVQKALDKDVFRSSNVFGGSSSGDTQSS